MNKEEILNKRIEALEKWGVQLSEFLEQQQAKKELTEKRLVEYPCLESCWHDIEAQKAVGWCASEITRTPDEILVRYERPFKQV